MMILVLYRHIPHQRRLSLIIYGDEKTFRFHLQRCRSHNSRFVVVVSKVGGTKSITLHKGTKILTGI